MRATAWHRAGVSRGALVLIAAAIAGHAVADEPACAAQLQAERVRIESDYARQRPDPADAAAFARWSQRLQAALVVATRQADLCRLRSKVPADEVPAATAAAEAAPQNQARRATLSTCLDQARLRGDDVARRYAGRELSPTEELRLRTEQDTLATQRQLCVEAPPP